MANWELREKRNKRKALVLSIMLHVIVLGGLAVYTGAGDFEIAIAEGSTMVRIGSLIFGPRV